MTEEEIGNEELAAEVEVGNGTLLDVDERLLLEEEDAHSERSAAEVSADMEDDRARPPSVGVSGITGVTTGADGIDEALARPPGVCVVGWTLEGANGIAKPSTSRVACGTGATANFGCATLLDAADEELVELEEAPRLVCDTGVEPPRVTSRPNSSSRGRSSP